MVGLTGLTIDSVLEGHRIRREETRHKANRIGWLLDDYSQSFPHKVYAVIMATAMAEAREGKTKFSFADIKAYTLRAVVAVGSEDYFQGERGINTLMEEGAEKTDFSSQVTEVKQQLASLSFEVSDLEELIASDLKKVEEIGGMQLGMAAVVIRDIAKAALTYVATKRNDAPYLLPIRNGRRAESYSLVLEGSRS